MHWLTDPQVWVALATLTALEIVLGIDNIIFIAILSAKLPAHQQGRARFLGLAIAMLTRVGLLFSLTWMMRLTSPLFAFLGHDFSGRDLILIGGGLFLLAKSTLEIHDKLEGHHEAKGAAPARAVFGVVVLQIVLLDIVFSLDSVITAIGLAKQIGVMVTAVVVAVIFMMAFARPISDFVDRHPTIRMLALSFLILIGVSLVGEGLSFHIPKGYIYFAMAFSVLVEMLNLRLRKVSQPVELRGALEELKRES
ncbi:MAG: TerC family protein [Candidatus Krumholzibacteria bacterium]|nr:TerC family protein [Candidatus Krumholzibacteria bacterium]MDH4336713.1 TerC family protein [Candidatus Krumholzibacteria bacterium]MDH5270744.1 TerC family protein [Candidatus Krumholzibacteria bacterium]MDH5628315.1 TerC family protein [Candidatus Krumholzibacteria bacterium]